MGDLQLETRHKQEILEILRSNIPDDIIIWVFGSRAKLTAKPYSDLDLALAKKDGLPIELKLITKLENKFEESSLPWKVDIVDLNNIDDNFRQIITRDQVLLTR